MSRDGDRSLLSSPDDGSRGSSDGAPLGSPDGVPLGSSEEGSYGSSGEPDVAAVAVGPDWRVILVGTLIFLSLIGGFMLIRYLIRSSTVKTAERNGMEQAVINELRVYDPLALTPEGGYPLV